MLKTVKIKSGELTYMITLNQYLAMLENKQVVVKKGVVIRGNKR